MDLLPGIWGGFGIAFGDRKHICTSKMHFNTFKTEWNKEFCDKKKKNLFENQRSRCDLENAAS